MNSRINQAHLRSTNNIRGSSTGPLRYPPNASTNLTSRSQMPPLPSDHISRKGADSGFSRTYTPASQAERTSVLKDSSRQDTDFKSKTVQFSKGTLDVLAKATEILKMSSKITIGASPATQTPGSDVYSNMRAPQYEKNTPSSVQSQTFSAKTSNVLGRADEILKRSVGYSRETANPATHKMSQFSEIPPRSREARHESLENRDHISNQTNARINNQITIKPPIDRENKTNNIFSRIDEALQKSLKITSNPNVPKADSHPEPMHQHTINFQEVNRGHQFETPPPRPPVEPIMSKELAHHQEIYKPPVNYNKEKPAAHSYQSSERGSTTHQDALKRSHEIVRKVDEDSNVRSSFVMERRLNMGSASPFSENKKDYNGSLSTNEVPPAAIHLPRTKKPKFVEEDYEDGTVYKGEKVRDEKHGRGEIVYPDGSRYEGEWEHDKRNGYGVQTFPHGNIQYDGEWKEDVYYGNGVLMNEDSREQRDFNYRDFDTLKNHWVKYEGEFLNGKKHGLGTLTLLNNERYVGKFKNDYLNGPGVFHLRNGETVTAEWENNKLVRV